MAFSDEGGEGGDGRRPLIPVVVDGEEMLMPNCQLEKFQWGTASETSIKMLHGGNGNRNGEGGTVLGVSIDSGTARAVVSWRSRDAVCGRSGSRTLDYWRKACVHLACMV